jgi:4-hydroxy-2-oxoglutarate aldolase
MAAPTEYMPALLTPFSQRGEIDTKAHAHNVRFLAEVGIEGFVIAGSNGEGPYLEPGERGRLVKTVRRRNTHLMVGINGETNRAAMAQISEATDAGADSVLVITPTTMVRGRDEYVAGYYKAVADHSRAPVFLYSVPSVTAYSLPIEVIEKLARHPNIVGMKDSSGDVVRLQSILDATPAGFILYSGASKALTAAIAIGCHGAITGSGNYAPELVLETLRLAKESPEKARRLQKRLSSLSAHVDGLGVPGVKAAAKAAGLKPGYPREPLTRLPRGAETSIAKLIT